MCEHYNLLELVETLLYDQKGEYLSELQRIVLAAALDDSGKRKTYEAIAEETGYSAKYIKQGIAPSLWQLLSTLLHKKVGKSNIRGVLTQYQKQYKQNQITNDSISSSTASNPPSKTFTVSPKAVPTSNAKAIILLVDDQPENLALLTDMLECEGYDVRQAINGKLALRVVKVQRPDLILLDVNMPELNGYEVCRQLKADSETASIPVIFISALSESWDKVQAFSVGAADYITKPPKVVEVMARITNQLNLAKAHQQFQQTSAHLHYSQQLLIEAGLVDPTMGLMTRFHFEKCLAQQWSQAIATQTSVGIIFINFVSLSIGSLAQFPVEWQPLIANVLSVVEPQDSCVAAFAPLTVAILLNQINPTTLEDYRGAIAKTLEPYKLPFSMDFCLVSHHIEPSAAMTSSQFLETCDKELKTLTSV